MKYKYIDFYLYQGGVQAQVFVVLSSGYINDGLYLH